MSQFDALIAKRLNKTEPSHKMKELADSSASGGLSTFNGLFQVTELSPLEKTHLEELLKTYAKKGLDITRDLEALFALTSEVKAINHQAALLHGERIKKAQKLLTRYEEGAFSAWLITTYGNRQTPYNLLQYYEFYQAVPTSLRKKVEEMPRQAIYTLASREGELPLKLKIISSYRGETKNEILIKIRELFPLSATDKRRENPGDRAIQLLHNTHLLLSNKKTRLSNDQKESLKELLTALKSVLQERYSC